MTFIVDKLEEARETYKNKFLEVLETIPNPEDWEIDVDFAYLDGLSDAIKVVKEAEKELEQRIWQAWVNEGVEPK